ncbi:hypothetical protein [Lewinella sp. 4G2]|nr:hypothetical protein [Lewinella sp. 4G2]
MDFWTAFPYLAMLVLIAFNAWLVIRRDIEVEDRAGEDPHH